MTTEEVINHFKALLKDEYAFDGRDRVAFEMTIKVLERSRWIPVNERLPETLMEKVLVTIQDENGLIQVPRMVIYDGFTETFDVGEKVVAWMPIPEPYRAESEDT